MSQKVEIEVRLDNKHFAEGANAVKMEISALSRHAASEGEKMGGIFDGLGKKVAGAFAVSKLVEFEKKIIDVRGEMESLRISFETLAGEHIGRQLYEDIKQFATTTPMMMNDLAKGAQTLLGFNIEAEKVMPILREIGDISMGDAQKFNSLTLAFAQMSSTGKLMGQDLLQMINAGFNPLVVISEKTGKSIGQLKDEMSKGAITVEMVEDAFRTATAEGGKFNGMLDKQSKGIKGAVSNLQGAWQDMLNDIGEQEQGVLVEGTRLATTLIQNYEKTGKILLTLVSTYGAYKAAVIAVTVAENFLNGTYTMKIRLLRAAAAAQALLNKTMLANPYVLAAMALAGLVTALVLFSKRTDEAAEAQKKLDQAFSDTQAEIASEQKKIDELFDKLRKAKEGTDEYKKVKDQILDQYGSYLQGLNSEIATLKDVEGAYRAVTKAAREAAIARGREAALRDVQDTYGKNYSDNMSKLQNMLNERLGSEKANEFLGRVQKELSSFGNITKQLEKRIQNALRGTAGYGVAPSLLQGLRNNEKYIKDYTKLVDERFKIDEKEANLDNQKKVRNKSVIEEEKKTLQAKLENLSKEKAAGEEGSKIKQEIAKLDKELKAYSVTDKSGVEAEKERSKKSADELQDQWKHEQEMAELEESAARSREDAAIASIQNQAEREHAEREAQYRRTLEDLKKQEDGIYKTIYEQRKTTYEIENKGMRYENTTQGSVGYIDLEARQKMVASFTDEERRQFDLNQEHFRSEREKTEKEFARYNEDRQKQELQAMRDYLKEYGTFQQQKLAIAEEYAEKIKEANTEAEKLRLKAEQQRLETQVDVNAIKQSVDWGSVFGNFGSIFKEQLEPMLEKLKKITESNAFKETSYEGQQVVFDLIDKLNQASATFDGDIFVKVSDAMRNYQEKMQDLIAAQDDEKEAVENLKKAQANLEKAKAEGDSEAVKKYNEQVRICTAQQMEASQNVKDCSAAANQATSEMRSASDKAVSMFTELASGIQKLTSGSLQGIGEGLMTLDKLFNKGEVTNAVGNALAKGFTAIFGKDSQVTKSISEALGDSGMIGQIIAAILSILDILKEGFGKLIADLIDTILGAIDGILDNILSGKFIEQIVWSLIKGIGNILNTVTRAIGNVLTLGAADGGILDWLGLKGGGNADEVQEKDDKLIKANENLERSINKLKESFDKYAGIKAIETSRDIVEGQKAYNENIMGRFENDMGYHNAHHSNAYYWDNFSDQQIAAMNALLANKGHSERINSGDWHELTVLSPEALDDIRTYLPEIWDFITSRGKYDWVYDSLNEYADQAGKIAEQEEALKENLSQLSKTSLHDSFVSDLMDMTKKAEDFGEDFKEILMKAVLNAQIGSLLDEDLEAWRTEMASRMEANGGTLTDQDVEELRRMWDMLVEKGIATRDEVAKVTGYTADAVEEAAGAFGNLRETFLDTLTDMEDDAESFKKKLVQIMVKDLIEKQVLDVPLTIDIDGAEQQFDNFEAYAADWNKRYAEAVKSGNQEAIDALIDELVRVRELTVEAANELRERLKDAVPDDTTFKDMADSWTSELMDLTKSAEDWAQEVGRIMAEKIISQMIAPVMMQPLLDTLQKAFNTAMSAGGATWQSVLNDGGVAAALSAIKDAYPELQEVVRQIMEAFGITVSEEAKEGFGDLKSTIISSLMDSEGDMEKFGKELGKSMVEQMIKTMTEQKYGEQIKALNAEWAEALESGDPEKIETIRRKVLELYAAIGNDEAIKGLLDDIREVAEEDTPFDNLRSSALSMFMDISKGAHDLVKDLKGTFAEMLIDKFVLDDVFNEQLDYYRQEWRKIMDDPGLSPEERTKSLRELADTVGGYLSGKEKEAEEWSKLMGIYEHEDQQATMNMANAATYDQFELYLGMETSHLMVAEQTKGITEQILSTLQGMSGITQPGTNYQEQIFMRLGTTNETLLSMKKEMERMHSDFGQKFDNMNSHLTKL